MKLAKCCCSLGLVIAKAFAAIKTGGRNPIIFRDKTTQTNENNLFLVSGGIRTWSSSKSVKFDEGLPLVPYSSFHVLLFLRAEYNNTSSVACSPLVV